MVNTRDELHLRWLERVVRWEMDVQEEHTTRVGRVVGSHNGGLPVEVVVLVLGTGGAVGWWVLAEVDEFLLNPLESHLFVLNFS